MADQKWRIVRDMKLADLKMADQKTAVCEKIVGARIKETNTLNVYSCWWLGLTGRRLIPIIVELSIDPWVVTWGSCIGVVHAGLLNMDGNHI